MELRTVSAVMGLDERGLPYASAFCPGKPRRPPSRGAFHLGGNKTAQLRGASSISSISSIRTTTEATCANRVSPPLSATLVGRGDRSSATGRRAYVKMRHPPHTRTATRGGARFRHAPCVRNRGKLLIQFVDPRDVNPQCEESLAVSYTGGHLIEEYLSGHKGNCLCAV